MRAIQQRRGIWQALASGLIAITLCCNAWSDARSEYLINMLENGGSYRIKVQAANTLGKIRCIDALPALVRALGDENELVVIATATALGQIGDTSVIPKMQAAAGASSGAAKTQIETTLRILKALTPEGDTTEVEMARKEWLIRVDAMGNSAGVKRADITDTMRDMVVKLLRKEPGVELQEPSLKPKQIKRKLKKEKLSGYIFSGSILRMEHVEDQMIVKISLNVFSNPDYNLLMMPSAEGAVTVMKGPLTRETERDAQDRALRAVADALIKSVFKKLQAGTD